MVKREPDETGGDYYFMLPEGTIQNWDGGAVKVAPALLGLDANRNFPADWGPHWEQEGAGEYPLSEPETRALAAFLVAHPNIHGAQHFHTFSGAILRSPTRFTEADLPELDRRLRSVESRLPRLAKRRSMTRAELAAELRASADGLTEVALRAELAPILPPDELVGLVPRLRSAAVRLAERLEGEDVG